jgi:PAS domain S-box-containing protein
LNADFLDKENKLILAKNAEKRMKNLEVATYEIKATARNAETKFFEVKGKRIQYEGKPVDLVVLHDVTDRKKKADEQIRSSEEKYKNLFENARDVILTLDLTGKVTSVNEAVTQYGFKRNEVVGSNIVNLVPKEYHKNFLMGLKNIQAAKPSQGEVTVLTAAGKRVVEYKSSPIIENGNINGYQTILRDITERKQTEEALKENEERSRAIVANSPIGIATSDANKHFRTANEAFIKILGYSEDELQKLTFQDLTHPEDTKESILNMEKLVTGNITSFTQEKRYIRKDGKIIDGRTMVSSIRNPDGKPILFIAELEDITERKRKERELSQEKKKLEAITQSIGAGFVIISKDYRVLWANTFIKEYKGNVEGQLCYATLNDLTHVCPDCGVKKIFENGANLDSHEYSSTDIKGNPYCVELIATPIKDEAGNVVSAVEIAVDITEKKNLQTKLAQYSQKLEKLVEERTQQLEETQLKLVKSERLAAIGELAGMIGHDLRNPLTGIKNAAYFLKKKGLAISETESKAMLEIIEKGIDHSDKIIRDLLDYAREIRLEIEECKLETLLTQTLTTIKIPEKIKIINNIPNNISIKLDPDKIERVFINLIKNAIDAMPNGGTITIDSKQLNDNVEISFADTGVGIPQNVLPKIFSPLFTTKAQGMGFGLAICKRIIEAHGGKITVETNAEGTTFTVTLPEEPKLNTQNEDIWINLPEKAINNLPKTNE